MIIGIIFSILGALGVYVVIFKWKKIAEAEKPNFFVKLFGKSGARFFYAAVSLYLLGFGIRTIFI
jgi:hypothetical protein